MTTAESTPAELDKLGFDIPLPIFSPDQIIDRGRLRTAGVLILGPDRIVRPVQLWSVPERPEGLPEETSADATMELLEMGSEQINKLADLSGAKVPEFTWGLAPHYRWTPPLPPNYQLVAEVERLFIPCTGVEWLRPMLSEADRVGLLKSMKQYRQQVGKGEYYLSDLNTSQFVAGCLPRESSADKALWYVDLDLRFAQTK